MCVCVWRYNKINLNLKNESLKDHALFTVRLAAVICKQGQVSPRLHLFFQYMNPMHWFQIEFPHHLCQSSARLLHKHTEEHQAQFMCIEIELSEAESSTL